MADRTTMAERRAGAEAGRRKRIGPLDYTRRWWLRLVVAFTFLTLYAPIVTLIAYSFNDSRRNIVWRGFTFKYYEKAWNNDGLFEAFVNSLSIAVVNTLISTILGVLVAIALWRFRFAGKAVYEGFMMLPIVIPEICMGVAMMAFFARIGWPTDWPWPLTLLNITISHIAFSFPFVAVIVRVIVVVIVCVIVRVMVVWHARILTEDKRLYHHRNGEGRHAHAAEVDVVEVPERDPVEHQHLGRDAELVFEERAQRLGDVGVQNHEQGLSLGQRARQRLDDAAGESGKTSVGRRSAPVERDRHVRVALDEIEAAEAVLDGDRDR